MRPRGTKASPAFPIFKLVASARPRCARSKACATHQATCLSYATCLKGKMQNVIALKTIGCFSEETDDTTAVVYLLLRSTSKPLGA